MTKALQIAHAAQSLVDVPWVHQGRTANGIDCVGLVLWSLGRAGWTPKDAQVLEWTDYTRRASDEHVLAWARAESVRELALVDECEVGDVLVIRYEGDQHAQHVGILTRKRGDGVLFWVHASSEEGRVIEHRLSPQWRARFVAGFRFVDEGANDG